MPNFNKKENVGAIFDFHGFQKGTFWTTLSPKWEKKRNPDNDLGRTSTDPVFHETIVIALPFGPSVFRKVICSIKVGSFGVFSILLCAMFYIQFVSQLLIIPR